jgi:hypothetical protein
VFINYLKIFFEVIFEFRRIKCFKAFFDVRTKQKKNNALACCWTWLEYGTRWNLTGPTKKTTWTTRHLRGWLQAFCFPFFFFNISQLLIYKFYFYYSYTYNKYDIVFCGFYQGIFMWFYAHKVITWKFFTSIVFRNIIQIAFLKIFNLFLNKFFIYIFRFFWCADIKNNF